MKITNSIIHDLLLVNKPPGISLWRAYLPSVISLIPLMYFSYRALLCIGYKKKDFKLRKKITSYGVTRHRIIGRRMEVILYRFIILFGIIFLVAKITEQPSPEPTQKTFDVEGALREGYTQEEIDAYLSKEQQFVPYDGEIIPLE